MGESGEVRVTQRRVPDGGGEPEEVEVDRLHAGGYFGEAALISHEPRNATVWADSDAVKVAAMGRPAYDSLMGRIYMN